MKIYTDIKISSMTGLGPTAWDRDTQKVSIHPPLPGHMEFVDHEMEVHEHQHHIVHRAHPENDNEETLIRKELTLEELQPHHHQHHLLHHHHPDNDQKEVAPKQKIVNKDE